MKKYLSVLMLLFLALPGFAEDQIPLEKYILGYWGTSEESFEQAETSGEYVEVKEDGTLRFFELTDEGEEERFEASWTIEDGKLMLYIDEELVIEAVIEIVEDGKMIWTNQHEEPLYLVAGAG